MNTFRCSLNIHVGLHFLFRHSFIFIVRAMKLQAYTACGKIFHIAQLFIFYPPVLRPIIS